MGTPSPLRHRCRTDFKQDVLTRKAVGLVDRRAPKPKPFFLWLTYTASHGGGPNPKPQPAQFDCPGHREAGAAPCPRVQLQPLPRPPNFNEAERLPTSTAKIRNRQPPESRSQIADIRRSPTGAEIESLLSVDDGVGGGRSSTP